MIHDHSMENWRNRSLSIKNKVFQALKEFGPMTDEEVAESLQRKVTSVRPEMTHLVQDGEVEEIGKKEITRECNGRSLTYHYRICRVKVTPATPGMLF